MITEANIRAAVLRMVRAIEPISTHRSDQSRCLVTSIGT